MYGNHMRTCALRDTVTLNNLDALIDVLGPSAVDTKNRHQKSIDSNGHVIEACAAIRSLIDE